MATVQINRKQVPSVTMIMSFEETQALAEFIIHSQKTQSTIGKYIKDIDDALKDKGFNFHYSGEASNQISRRSGGIIEFNPRSLEQLHEIVAKKIRGMRLTDVGAVINE